MKTVRARNIPTSESTFLFVTNVATSTSPVSGLEKDLSSSSNMYAQHVVFGRTTKHINVTQYLTSQQTLLWSSVSSTKFIAFVSIICKISVDKSIDNLLKCVFRKFSPKK